MKRIAYYYLLVIILSVLPLWSLLITIDIPHTHDGFVHLVRIAAYAKALRDGQILPRWASDLNYGYGMPLFNFIYHTPYLIASLMVFLGTSLVQSFKFTLALSFVIAGIGMYAFAYDFFRDTKKALLVTVFYQFAPFRLVELLIRGSFGEVYTYAFFPIILLGLSRLRNTIHPLNIGITSIATALLIISHNSISLTFFLISIGFIVFFSPSIRYIIWALGSLVGGLLLSAFYWIPAVLEHKYTLGDLYMKDLYLTHFPPLVNFFLPYEVNVPHLQTGGVPVQFGLFHVIALLLVGYALHFRKNLLPLTKKTYFFCLSAFGVALFFMQPISLVFWKALPTLRQFQFPWRLLSVTTVVTAFASVAYTHFLNKPRRTLLYIALLGLTIASTIPSWTPPLGFDRVPDESLYWNYPLTSTYFGETDLVWSAGPAKTFSKNRFEIIEGDALINDVKLSGTKHRLTVIAKTNTRVVDHTQYFPGWRVTVDGVKLAIEFQDQLWRGLITFRVPIGKHSVIVAYEKSKIQIASEMLSIISLGGIIVLFVFNKKIFRV